MFEADGLRPFLVGQESTGDPITCLCTEGEFIVTGTLTGKVSVWDTSQEPLPPKNPAPHAVLSEGKGDPATSLGVVAGRVHCTFGAVRAYSWSVARLRRAGQEGEDFDPRVKEFKRSKPNNRTLQYTAQSNGAVLMQTRGQKWSHLVDLRSDWERKPKLPFPADVVPCDFLAVPGHVSSTADGHVTSTDGHVTSAELLGERPSPVPSHQQPDRSTSRGGQIHSQIQETSAAHPGEKETQDSGGGAEISLDLVGGASGAEDAAEEAGGEPSAILGGEGMDFDGGSKWQGSTILLVTRQPTLSPEPRPSCMRRCLGTAPAETHSLVKVWDVTSAEPRCEFVVRGTGPSRFLGPDRLVCANGKKLEVYAVNGGWCLFTLKGHTRNVRCFSAVPPNSCVSFGDDFTLRIWLDDKCVRKIPITRRLPTDCCLSFVSVDLLRGGGVVLCMGSSVYLVP